jgi:hypothetical protein
MSNYGSPDILQVESGAYESISVDLDATVYLGYIPNLINLFAVIRGRIFF